MKEKLRTTAVFPLISALLTSAVVGGYALVFGDSNTAVEERDALSVGDRGNEVAALQEKLKLYGYYDGEVDGVYDLATSEAVRRFRLDEGRADIGEAKEYELYALGVYADESIREMRLGDEGMGVLRLQRELKRLGYYGGEVSGRYGVMTAAAVRRWQGKNGVRVTGVCDRRMVVMLGLDGGIAAAGDERVLEVLGRLVASVGGEMDYRGQVGVAAEAMRRWRGGEGTIYAVSAAMAREMGEGGIAEESTVESRRAAMDAVMGMMG